MCRLIETLKINDGILHNVDFHNRRINSVRRELFGSGDQVDLAKEIRIDSLSGLVKCRVLYDRFIHEVQFIPYQFPHIRSLQLVRDDLIAYAFKYEDRRNLKALFDRRGMADDILIVKNGKVTDSYFCNVVFEKGGLLYTPSACLLRGTKRQQLLESGIIREKPIGEEEIPDFEKVYLINAMIDLKDEIAVDIEKVFF